MMFNGYDNQPTECASRYRTRVQEGEFLHDYPNGTSAICYKDQCGKVCTRCGLPFALMEGHWVQGEQLITMKQRAEKAEQERDRLLGVMRAIYPTLCCVPDRPYSEFQCTSMMRDAVPDLELFWKP